MRVAVEGGVELGVVLDVPAPVPSGDEIGVDEPTLADGVLGPDGLVLDVLSGFLGSPVADERQLARSYMSFRVSTSSKIAHGFSPSLVVGSCMSSTPRPRQALFEQLEGDVVVVRDEHRRAAVSGSARSWLTRTTSTPSGSTSFARSTWSRSASTLFEVNMNAVPSRSAITPAASAASSVLPPGAQLHVESVQQRVGSEYLIPARPEFLHLLDLLEDRGQLIDAIRAGRQLGQHVVGQTTGPRKSVRPPQGGEPLDDRSPQAVPVGLDGLLGRRESPILS